MNKNWGIDKESLKKRFLRQCVPYFAYCLVFWGLFHVESLEKYLVRIVYGGSMNTTAFTYPFWFINSLFVTQIIYSWIKRKSLFLYSVLGGEMVNIKCSIMLYCYSFEIHIPT